MSLRILIAFVAFIFTACSSADRKPSCEQIADDLAKCKESSEKPIKYNRGGTLRER